jgi:hypothetical protein
MDSRVGHGEVKRGGAPALQTPPHCRPWRCWRQVVALPAPPSDFGSKEASIGSVEVKSRYEQLIAYIPLTGIGHNRSIAPQSPPCLQHR